MRYRIFWVLLAIVMFTVNVQAAPPKVVSITPENGAMNVDPNLKKIVIVFDQPMRGGRSITGSAMRAPEFTKRLFWKDNRTFVMPVKLYPDRDYYFGINSKSRRNFRGKNGESVVPIRVHFKTRKAKPGEKVNILPGPPEIVSMTIENGAKNVDPNLSEIEIKFDQPMSMGGWSVTGGGEMFPEIDGKLKWKDNRTFVMPVKLKPNHAYQFGVNSRSRKNFRSRHGVPAKWVRVKFKTRSADATEAEQNDAADQIRMISADSQLKVLDELEKSIQKYYALRDLRNVPWARLIENVRQSSGQPRAFETFTSDLRWILAHSQDAHINLQIDGRSRSVYMAGSKRNINPSYVNDQLTNVKQFGSGVKAGLVDEETGYLAIKSWSGKDMQLLEQLNNARDHLESCSKLVLDLRQNSGGNSLFAETVARCFIDKPVEYAQILEIDGKRFGSFVPARSLTLYPDNQVIFRGQVVLLVGQGTASSSEMFTLMMKQAPNCKVMGDRTMGLVGNPQPREIGEGIVVTLPKWDMRNPDGSQIEGVGIEPDILIEASAEDFENADPVFDAAVKYLAEH